MVLCKGINEDGTKCSIKNANYGLSSNKIKMFCKKHSLLQKNKDELVDLKNRFCIYIENNKRCKIRASFGFPGGVEEYCAGHGKQISSLIIQNYKKYCERLGCDKTPIFNYEGEKLGKFCFQHKELKMINVKSSRCAEEGCDSIAPGFDYPGGKGIFCGEHSKPGMIDIYRPKCIVCKERAAAYGFKEQNKETHCKLDKLEGMILISYKNCDECNIEVLYGYPGKPISKCFTHRKKGMIKRSNGRCFECKNLATYGFNFTVYRCELHCLPTDQNLSERECKKCNLIMILNKEELCEFCDPNMFNMAILVKQNSLLKALESQDIDIISIDKMIDNGVCGRERPDFVIDCNKFIIILECDENQHKDRNKECEDTRMKNIGQMYGGIPIYFIRFNPDKYKPGKNNNEESINKRYSEVCKLIKSIQDGTHKLSTDSLVSALYMYYDGWNNMNDAKWISITKFEKDITA